MAIFGRNTARQRLRRAAEESLRFPAFKAPVDCTPWVTGGLWPAELSIVTPETAPLVKYLKADLQRIVNSANEELASIRRAGLADPDRLAQEARVINDARGYAVRRIESSVRHLRNLTTTSPVPPPVNGTAEAAMTPRFQLASPRPEPEQPAETLTPPTEFSPADDPDGWEPADDTSHGDSVNAEPAAVQPVSREAEKSAAPSSLDYAEAAEPAAGATDSLAVPESLDSDETVVIAVPSSLDYAEAAEPAARATDNLAVPESLDSDETVEIAVPSSLDYAEAAEPAVRTTARHAAPELPDSDDTEALDEVATLLQEFSVTLDPPPAAPPPPPQPATPPLPQQPVSMFEPASPSPAGPEPGPDNTATVRHALPPAREEAEPERLARLLAFVARQEPGLHWAVGNRDDGTTVLVTDLAHGWIPPGVTLPAEVRLLEPGRRAGTATALLGQTTQSATYAPGDPLGWSADYDATRTSPQPRALPAVENPGRVLNEATHWRDGLPRMVNTLAKAGARGTGVAGAELDILRAYLDTARNQLLAQYPDVDAGLLLNCLLLAATESVASNNWLTANYHLAWFHKLSPHDVQ